MIVLDASAAVNLVTWPLGRPERILQLRHDFRAHDADYIALAEELECPLITCDRKWLRTSTAHSAAIRVL